MDIQSLKPSIGYSTAENAKVDVMAAGGSTTPAQSELQEIRSAKQFHNEELKGAKFTVGEQQLIKNIERAVKAVQGVSMEYSVHEKTKQLMIKITDKETGEIVREIPPEKSQEFIAKMWELAGLFVDERK